MADDIPVQPVAPAKISKRSPDKVMNWTGYFRDMRVSVIRAVSGAFVAMSGSNTAEKLAPILAENVGMSLKQAIGMALSVAFFDIMRYVNINPQPPVIEENNESFYP